MKRQAIIFSVPMTMSPGFGWRWRSADHKDESTEWFVFRRDCLADAKRYGYEVSSDGDNTCAEAAVG